MLFRSRATIPTLKMKEVPVALDEWNYWYGPDLFGEIGTRYFLRDALGIAVDARVLAHDVLDGFDDGGKVGHAKVSGNGLKAKNGRCIQWLAEAYNSRSRA